MKLLPFTEANRQQLILQGYTHILLVRNLPAAERDYITDKDYYLYQALKISGENLHSAASSLASDEVTSLITNDNIDCYVLLKK
jgi:hypothetical protein